MSESLGDRVKRHRLIKGWTQGELAQRVSSFTPDMKIQQSTIQALEGGQAKRVTYLAELARALGVSAEYLAFGVVGNDAPKKENPVKKIYLIDCEIPTKLFVVRREAIVEDTKHVDEVCNHVIDKLGGKVRITRIDYIRSVDEAKAMFDHEVTECNRVAGGA